MKRLLLLGLVLPLLACAHGGEPDIATLASNSDQLIWEEGLKAYQKRQWENARQHFKRIVDGFPNSQYAPQARLHLAESYFHEEGGDASYILAVSGYREFLTLYPSHPQADYAQFQVGESFFRQRNGPDRDQTATRNALEEYQRLLEIYPQSPYVEQARGRIKEVRQSLARAEFLAGYFYQRTRQACYAAIPRYQGILTDYPDYERLDEVLFRLGECLHAQGRGLEALPLLSRLAEEHPQSPFLEPARRLIAVISTAPETPREALPSPAPSPSPSPAGGGEGDQAQVTL